MRVWKFSRLWVPDQDPVIKTLLANNGMNMNEHASSLNITNSALTSHIKKLESAAFVISNESPDTGTKKVYCASGQNTCKLNSQEASKIYTKLI